MGAEPKERPRKAPRLGLEMLLDAAADSNYGRDEALAALELFSLGEEGGKGTDPNKRCDHVPTDNAYMKMLSVSLSSRRAGKCENCNHPIEGCCIMVCLECGRHFCSGVGSAEYPFGHSRAHARREQHWVAALSEDPKFAFCFKCDREMNGPQVTVSALLAAAEENSESSDKSWASWPETSDSDDSCCIEPCTHVPHDKRHMEMLKSSLNSEHAGRCAQCEFVGSDIMVCMECGLHFCVGLGSVDFPHGHSRKHAKQEEHWVAALYDEPESAYCFKCDYVVSVSIPKDDKETDSRFQAGARVEYSYETRKLIQGLSHSFRSAYLHGYAIRGIPNMGNTCYLNAVVQCFLALDKLRARMLAPDAPKGLFACRLTDLFVGTIAAGSLLNTELLIRCLQMHKRDFQGCEMHDSHELLMSLFSALDEEEINTRHEQKDAPTVIKSIFGFKMCETRTCKCLRKSVSHPEFLDLSLTLVSQSHTTVSVATREITESSKSQRKKVAVQLFPPNEHSESERIQTVAETGDSHLPCSELKDVVVEGTGDSTEIQCIDQSKDVVMQSPLRTEEDKVTCPEVSERLTEVPVKSASLLPQSVFDVKVEEINKSRAGSISSVEDCLSLFLDDVLEWRCDNCSKVHKELNSNKSKSGDKMVAIMEETTTVEGKQDEQSDRTTCKNDQSSSSNSFSVESKSSSSRQPHGSDAQGQTIQTDKDKLTGRTNLEHHSEDMRQSKMYLERMKQTELDHSVCQLEDNRNEQDDKDGYAIQTRRFMKLPPVLTLHFRRSSIDGFKISDHVRYKEYLDVEPFMDPSSVDKGNSIYRLVGVVEHRGTVSVLSGHYVAYVRAKKLGNLQQQGSCSHSWFCADDSTISEVSLEDVLKREAYILFYERMEG